jgi:multidrug efflux system membrane fusion protein
MTNSSSHTVDLARIQQYLGGAGGRPVAQLKRRVFFGAVAVALLGGGGAALYHATAKSAPAAPAAAPVAVPVTTEIVKPRRVSPWAEFSGRIDAVDYAELRPEVSGRIAEIRFRDG